MNLICIHLVNIFRRGLNQLQVPVQQIFQAKKKSFYSTKKNAKIAKLHVVTKVQTPTIPLVCVNFQ